MIPNLKYEGVTGAQLQDVWLELTPGLHVVLGTPGDGTVEVLELLAGVRAPRRGRVLVAEGEPAWSPETRKLVASVLPEEVLVPSRTVEESVALALRARGDDAGAAARVLGAFDLQRWARRSPMSLDRSERRALAFALAAANSRALVFAVDEPLAALGPISRERALATIEERLQRGGIVVCSTASPSDALALANAVLVLERGRFSRKPAPALTELTPGGAPEFAVHTPDARRLASALASDPSVSTVLWDEQQAPGELRVRGADLEAVSLAIVQLCARERVALGSLLLATPSLDAVRAASGGLTRAAFDNAREAALTYIRRNTYAPAQPSLGSVPTAGALLPPTGAAGPPSAVPPPFMTPASPLDALPPPIGAALPPDAPPPPVTGTAPPAPLAATALPPDAPPPPVTGTAPPARLAPTALPPDAPPPPFTGTAPPPLTGTGAPPNAPGTSVAETSPASGAPQPAPTSPAAPRRPPSGDNT